MSNVLINGRPQPVLFPTSNIRQRFHQRWWTTLPSIPTSQKAKPYRRLWRQFADHTMNTWSERDGICKPGSRGFYVEGREDHLVPAFFENYSLLPDWRWLETLLARLRIPEAGRISDAAWAYSYSELLPAERIRPHADIVFMWHDDQGEAVLVIEAKKPGCGRAGITFKDYPSNGYYLKYASMQRITRRYQALLVDQSDIGNLVEVDGTTSFVVTWQDLIGIQRDAVKGIRLPADIERLVLSRLDAHYSALGFVCGREPPARGDRFGYSELMALNAPESVKSWLVGSEIFFAAREREDVVEPPYAWLDAELTAADYRRGKHQSTAERERLIWRIQR